MIHEILQLFLENYKNLQHEVNDKLNKKLV